MSKTTANPEVFKAYDVRGLYPSEITEDLFRSLGRAFVAYLGPGRRYAVTRDMRVSSPSLTKAFIDGARAQGGIVFDYGLTGTDMMYFAVAADHLDGGAQITASHNPKQYNGCKMVREHAFPLSGESGIKEMKEMIVADALPPVSSTPGRYEKPDVGIAWDGDADRCFFLDGTGEFIAGDFVTALLAEAFLMKHPGSTIIYDVRASYAVKDVVARYGGRGLLNRVGHAFIKRRMREENAIFGGEVTGHYYFRDNFYADNGFIPALMILDLMSKKGMSLRDLLKPLRERYFISGEINTKVASMALINDKLSALEREYRSGHVYRLDGISVE